MPLTWAYPGGQPGSYRDWQDRVLRQHGFELRFSTLEGAFRPDRPDAVQCRYVIRHGSSARYFRSALDGGLQLVSWLKRANAALDRTRKVTHD